MFQSLRVSHLLHAALLLAYLLAGVISPAPSHTVVQPGYVYDEFKKIEIKAPTDGDNDPYWWIINNGDGAQTYANCADATCVTAENEGSLKFARLQLNHDTTPAVWDGSEYNGTEISEYRTMYSSTLPGRWLPTFGHPVSISARVRFSPNYAPDGSGGAVGSAGLWLWNSYPATPDYAPANAFGFNWSESGAAGGLGGLQVTALQATIPVYSQPVGQDLDLSDWHTWSFTWSADAGGAQSLEWGLDGASVGQTQLAEPFQALSLTFWNDNQFPTFLENGQYSVVFHNPSAEQEFDIDWVEIDQPQ